MFCPTLVRSADGLDWPLTSVSGVASYGDKGAAIIGGAIIQTGGSTDDGVQLMSIEGGRANLKFQDRVLAASPGEIIDGEPQGEPSENPPRSPLQDHVGINTNVQLVSLHVQHLPLEIFRSVCTKLGSFNVLYAGILQGVVTINVDDRPLDEVLVDAFTANGYGFVTWDGINVVIPKREIELAGGSPVRPILGPSRKKEALLTISSQSIDATEALKLIAVVTGVSSTPPPPQADTSITLDCTAGVEPLALLRAIVKLVNQKTGTGK